MNGLGLTVSENRHDFKMIDIEKVDPSYTVSYFNVWIVEVIYTCRQFLYCVRIFNVKRIVLN